MNCRLLRLLWCLNLSFALKYELISLNIYSSYLKWNGKFGCASGCEQIKYCTIVWLTTFQQLHFTAVMWNLRSNKIVHNKKKQGGLVSTIANWLNFKCWTKGLKSKQRILYPVYKFHLPIMIRVHVGLCTSLSTWGVSQVCFGIINRHEVNHIIVSERHGSLKCNILLPNNNIWAYLVLPYCSYNCREWLLITF